MGRITLITGANRGIGRELAAQLVRDGETVLLGARDMSAAEAAVAELGAQARPVQIDTADQASIDAAASRIETEFGRQIWQWCGMPSNSTCSARGG
jgi:NAD(P)-dependent dehydrogenase (short-subunit alcohol dehydrogenase family)